MSSSIRFEMRTSECSVEAWSDVRLPFQARTGEIRRFRDAVRAGVGRLPRQPVVRAVYQSADSTPCDVENIALYNFGSAPFRGLGGEALVVERPRGSGPRAPSGAPLAHYLGYESLAVVPDWQGWRPHRRLVAWAAAPVQGEFTATNLWAALKRGVAAVHRTWDGEGRLGVIVRVPGKRSLVEAVKPLVDAVVSAAHDHDGPDAAGAAALVAVAVAEPPEVVAAWLTGAASVLGPRRLVLPRDDKFQWNPCDDAIAAIRLERATADVVEAELWTLAPVVPD